MNDTDAIAANLKEYLEADYFAGAIKDVCALIHRPPAPEVAE